MLESDNPDTARSEVEFHRAVLDLGGQFTLASLGHLLEAVVSRHASENQADSVGNLEAHRDAHRAHRLIVEAIQERDPLKAERRMLKHLRAALETMPLQPTDRANIFGPSVIDLRSRLESRTGSA
jgi:DNA-binding FadR family transcriptional regulator